MLWSIGRAELLDDYRGLAVVAVVVGGELAAAIGTQVAEAKSERHKEVLYEFDQSRRHFVFVEMKYTASNLVQSSEHLAMKR